MGTELKQNGCSAGQIINPKMKLYLPLTNTDGYTIHYVGYIYFPKSSNNMMMQNSEALLFLLIQ